jgi:ABC-type transporter Mla MlaB component
MSNIEAQLAVSDQSHWCLSGEMTFVTAQTLIEMLQSKLNEAFSLDGNLSIDLSRVTHTDSAALAIIFECLRIAKQHNKKLYFTHLPKQLQEIIRISSTEFLFSATDEK